MSSFFRLMSLKTTFSPAGSVFKQRLLTPIFRYATTIEQPSRTTLPETIKLWSDLRRLRLSSLHKHDPNDLKKNFDEFLVEIAKQPREVMLPVLRAYLNQRFHLGIELDFDAIVNIVKLDDYSTKRVVFSSFLEAACEAGNMDLVGKLLDEMRKCNLTPNASNFSNVLHGYIKSNCPNEVVATQEIMARHHYWPSLIAYEKMMLAYADLGDTTNLFELLSEAESFAERSDADNSTPKRGLNPVVYLKLYSRLATAHRLDSVNAKQEILDRIKKQNHLTAVFCAEWSFAIKQLLVGGLDRDALNLFAAIENENFKSHQPFLSSLASLIKDWEKSGNIYDEFFAEAGATVPLASKLIRGQLSYDLAEKVYSCLAKRHQNTPQDMLNALAAVAVRTQEPEKFFQFLKNSNFDLVKIINTANTVAKRLNLNEKQLNDFFPDKAFQSGSAFYQLIDGIPRPGETEKTLEASQQKLDALLKRGLLPFNHVLTGIPNKLSAYFALFGPKSSDLDPAALKDEIEAKLNLMLNALHRNMHPIALENLLAWCLLDGRTSKTDDGNISFNQEFKKQRVKTLIDFAERNQIPLQLHTLLKDFKRSNIKVDAKYLHEEVPLLGNRIASLLNDGKMEEAITLIRSKRHQTTPTPFVFKNDNHFLKYRSRGITKVFDPVEYCLSLKDSNGEFKYSSDQLIDLFDICNQNRTLPKVSYSFNLLLKHFIQKNDFASLEFMLPKFGHVEALHKTFFKPHILRAVLENRPSTWPLLRNCIDSNTLNFDFCSQLNSLYKAQPTVPEGYSAAGDLKLPPGISTDLPWPALSLAAQVGHLNHMKQVRSLSNEIRLLCKTGALLSAYNMHLWSSSLGLVFAARENEILNVSPHIHAQQDFTPTREHLQSLLHVTLGQDSLLDHNVISACDAALNSQLGVKELSMAIGQAIADYNWEMLKKTEKFKSFQTPMNRWCMLENLINVPGSKLHKQNLANYFIAKEMLSGALKHSKEGDDNQLGTKLWYSWYRSQPAVPSAGKAALLLAALESSNDKLKQLVNDVLNEKNGEFDKTSLVHFAVESCNSHPVDFNEQELKSTLAQVFGDQKQLNDLWELCSILLKKINLPQLKGYLNEHRDDANLCDNLALIVAVKNYHVDDLLEYLPKLSKEVMNKFANALVDFLSKMSGSHNELRFSLLHIPNEYLSLKNLAMKRSFLTQVSRPITKETRENVFEKYIDQEFKNLNNPELESIVNNLKQIIFSDSYKVEELAVVLHKIAVKHDPDQLYDFLQACLYAYKAIHGLKSCNRLILDSAVLTSDVRLSKVVESLSEIIRPLFSKLYGDALVNVARFQQQLPLTEFQMALITFHNLNSYLVPRPNSGEKLETCLRFPQLARERLSILAPYLVHNPMDDKDLKVLLEELRLNWGATRIPVLFSYLVELGAETTVDQVVRCSPEEIKDKRAPYSNLVRIFKHNGDLRKFDDNFKALISYSPELLISHTSGFHIYKIIDKWPISRLNNLMELANHLSTIPTQKIFSYAVFAHLVRKGIIKGNEPIFDELNKPNTDLLEVDTELDRLVAFVGNGLSNKLLMNSPSLLGSGPNTKPLHEKEMLNTIEYINNRDPSQLPVFVDACATIIAQNAKMDPDGVEAFIDLFKVLKSSPALRASRLSKLCQAQTLRELWETSVFLKKDIPDDAKKELATALKETGLLS